MIRRDEVANVGVGDEVLITRHQVHCLTLPLVGEVVDGWNGGRVK